MQTKLILLPVLALFAFTASSHADEDRAAEEHQDRIVDEAAVDTQSEAERDLVELIQKYRGTPREAGLQLRLAELRMEIADTLFRVVYAPGQEKLRKAHRATLTRALSPLTRILDAYPRANEAPRALFLRGKAQRELGAIKGATRDLEAFLARYPQREEASLAAIGVADLSIQSKNFKRAISVLQPIASKPSHPFYAHALQKRAWSFHVEGQNLRAVNELQRLAAYFKTADASEIKGLSAIRESVISDVPSIAYSAFRDSPKNFSLNKVNELLRSYDTAQGYRDMASHVADRLRAADLATELHTWKMIVLKSDPSKKDNLRILVSILEYELDREAYADAVNVANEVAQIVAANPEGEYVEESRSLVLKAAERLTKRITDYKKNVKSTKAERTLNALLPAIDQLLGEKDARRFAIRWNLAETLFSLERYESAAQAYRWVYLNGADNTAVTIDAGLKAISSRYEQLRGLNVVPKDLEVRPTIRPNLSQTKLASLREWISWIDELYTKKLSAKNAEILSRMRFESNRSLYQAGFQDESMERLRANALTDTNSSVAVASAALVVDTWIARKNWERVEAHSMEFARTSGWTEKSFGSRMATQAAQARFKRAEESYARKDYKAALEHSMYFVKNYRKNPMALDARGIACNSTRAMGDADATLSCLEDLISEHPRSQAAREALRTAAQIQDDRFQFLSAADYYERYLKTSGSKVPAKEATALRARILKLVRASGDASRMEKSAKDRKLCAGFNRAGCELNATVAALLRGAKSTYSVNHAISMSGRASRSLRAVWATIALESEKGLTAQQFDRVLGSLVASWKDSDVSVRYLLIPRLTHALPDVLAQGREDLQKMKLEATEASLLRRLKAVESLEKRAEVIGKLPLNSIKLGAFEHTYGAYADLIEDLRSIPAPKKSSAAQKAEHQALLNAMARPFVLKSRRLKDQMSALAYKERSGLDIDAFEDLWDRKSAARSHLAEAIRNEWPKAIRNGAWVRVAFFADESDQVNGLSKDWVKAARAMSLARSGAEAEARILFSDTCRSSSDGSVKGMCREAIQNRKGRG